MVTIYALISELKDVSVVVSEVRETAVTLGSTPDAVEDLALALYEAIVNSSIHGYQHHPGQIEIDLQQHGEDLLISLRDDAPLFNPLHAPKPDISLPLEQRRLGGMGIHLMRNFTDELHYQIIDTDQNEVILIKKNAFIHVSA